MSTYLINFTPVDAESIEAGTRRQVCRRHRADHKRLRVGDSLKLYVRLRTSFGRLIKEVRVAEVMSIRLGITSGELVIDGRKADADEAHDIAVREGYADSWHWRYELGKDPANGTEFEGYVARW